MDSTISVMIDNSTAVTIESWFIPIDILMIIFTSITIILSSLFLFIIITDKVLHTVPMFLIGNSCLTTLVTGCALFGTCLFSLQNDLQQIKYQDPLCICRVFILNASASILYSSYLLQAFYRYLLVLYPYSSNWHSLKSQFFLVCLTWIISFLYPIPYTLTGDIIYNVDNQICQKPLGLSLTAIYIALTNYVIPVSLIAFIYWKLVRYVHQIGQRATPVNTLNRAKNELKLLRHTIILVAILIIVCFPNDSIRLYIV